MNYELPSVLVRFGSEFILSNAKIRCAAAVRAQHGDALGLVTWSWQRGWATSMQPSSFHSLCRPLSSGPSAAAAAARAHGGRRRRRRRREEEAQRVYGWRGGAASFRRADTAKVCNNVGLVFSNGVFECSDAKYAEAATQGVSGRLRARQGLRHLSLAATSAFNATSTRHVSRWPLQAEHIRGVHPLKKQINKKSFGS